MTQLRYAVRSARSPMMARTSPRRSRPREKSCGSAPPRTSLFKKIPAYLEDLVVSIRDCRRQAWVWPASKRMPQSSGASAGHGRRSSLSRNPNTKGAASSLSRNPYTKGAASSLSRNPNTKGAAKVCPEILTRKERLRVCRAWTSGRTKK
jgi:hypothetical protein